MVTLHGMTWDHRRATEPLLALDNAFRKHHPHIDIVWRSRPLAGFEFDSIEGLAAENDLIVYDHPFCGRIAETHCMLPVDALIDEDVSFVGPSVASYRYGNECWAVPIDAACQVATYRPDLLGQLDIAVPKSWDDVCELGGVCNARGLSIIIGLKGAHSLMTFFSLCANLGGACADDPAEPLFDEAVATEVLVQMRRLVKLCQAPVLDWNSIEVHEALSTSEQFVYCPAVYGYAAYGEADQENRLGFGPFPGITDVFCAGSTIGGAGLGVSSRVINDPETNKAALAYVRFAARAQSQRAIIALNHGQPAHLAAWDDTEIDGYFGGFFSTTRETIEKSWVRPRYDGYLTFQAKAGGLIEAHLRGDLAEHQLIDRLMKLHEDCQTV